MQMTSIGEYQLSRFMLSTAQFGAFNDGNLNEKASSFKEICSILESAFERGITCLDAAPLCETNEEVLGKALQATRLQEKFCIVAKAVYVVDESLSQAKIQRAIEAEIRDFLRHLQLEVLPVCLLSSEVNFRYIDALLKLQEKGLVAHVGCSINDVTKARGIYRSGRVEVMQIPLNIFDRRLTNPRAGGLNFLDEATKRNVILFAKNIYLQGLLTADSKQQLPSELQEAIPTLMALRALADTMGIEMRELALRALLKWEKVSCIAVEAKSKKQLEESLSFFEKGPFTPQTTEAINSVIPNLSEKLLTSR